ncbi:glycoside hydrolase family 2 protein [Formosa sp. PL04]|uniref:glycoside hydrolase family 2 protein n=1 Tax=Formosa sp. PL04 TaxID=3081755 RepID=UPI002981E366|nr:glycoside hydrolase family 2 TIM barrel-domain containing protein [Formosa sp. PL04]MDW5288117.1 glycoside hydrolase family 2 TIM barrel-domain containing protein [Formosa sp. PL04]
MISDFKQYFQLLCFFCVTALSAQPDSTYINKIRGEVDTSWLLTIGNDIPPATLEWNLQTAPGFKMLSENARNSAVLENSWIFFPIINGKPVADGEKVTLPHDFDRGERDYVSGWYLSNYKLSKHKNKRYVLKLNRIQLFSEVYVNGKLIGHHFGGYTPFDFDITTALESGNNTIAIFVRDQSAALDGGKIYNQVGVTRLGNYNPDGGNKLKGGIESSIVLEEQEEVHLDNIFVKTSTRKNTLEINYDIVAKKLTTAKVSFEVFKWPNGERVALEIPEVHLKKEDTSKQTLKVNWKNPKLWSPNHPNLYVLRTTLKNGKKTEVVDTRFGFREFWIEEKQFVLNGVPARLLGQSHYRSSVEDIDYHRETFLMHKKVFEVNSCRIHATMPPNEIMYAADEAGILLIDQSAIWSVNKPFYSSGGDWFAKNIAKEFEEWVKRDRNNPSVVIWDVENEMLRFNFGTYEWIQYLPDYIKKFDNSRPINYSGAGWFDDEQEMISLHMQEHYTRIMKDWKSKGTRPLIMGEFWVGGRSEQRLSNSPEFSSVLDRNIEEAKLYEEKFLEMRNIGVAGVMPFRTGLLAFDKNPIENGSVFEFSNHSKIYAQPEVVLQKMRHGLQPVTTFFWPRQTYVATTELLKKELVVCNDSETENTFTVTWNWLENKYTKQVVLKPGSQERIALNLASTNKNSTLTASITLGNKQISADTLLIQPFVQPVLHQSKKIQVYKDDILVDRLKEAGLDAFSSEKIPTVKDNVIWLFPEHANNRELTTHKKEIETYLKNGGAVLSLKQDQAPNWYPIKFQFSSANQSNLHNYAKMGWEGLNKDLFFSTEAPIYDRSHPVFKGLNTDKLQGWSPYDNRVADDVFARPSSNNKYEQGNWTTLSGGTRREQVSLAEVFYGKGILLTCQLNVIDNLKNKQASGLFVNMINYLSNRKPELLKGKVQIAGDKSTADLSKLLGTTPSVFKGAKADDGDYMLVFDGATIEEIKAWVTKGGQVLVMSPTVANEFNDVNIGHSDIGFFATKINEEPILNGVSSANFMSTKTALAQSYFSTLPKNAKVVLQGFESNSTFWKVEKAHPIMVSIPFEGKDILLSTLQFSEKPIASQQEFLAQILTNCGVSISFLEIPELTKVSIKKTVPITVDGNLEEWIEDMEDKFVTQYIHAEPMYLTSENTIEGPQIFDLNLSAIDYIMWNENTLNIAGVVFMEEMFFGGENYPRPKNYKQQILWNDDVIIVEVINGKATVLINGKSSGNLLIATGIIKAEDMTDATKLQFNYIHASGKINTWNKMKGQTFELQIPWDLLKTKPTDIKGQALITLENKENKIQMPLKGDKIDKTNWLPLEIKESN